MNPRFRPKDFHCRVFVEDTDFQGVVYHANYIKFFERARSEFLATNNISQDMLRKNNLAFVIKSINIKYLAAAELGDEIEVNSIVQKKSDARMIFNQKILNSKMGIEYVDGDVEVCFINLLTKKPQKFPDDLLLIFK